MTNESEKIFTVEEANALIPELETRVTSLMTKKENYAKMHDHLFMHELLAQSEKQMGKSQGTEVDDEAQDLEAAIEDMEKDICEIRKMGCVLRDLDHGYVDFPSQNDGQRIFLCWKIGEKSIQFYRTSDNDKAERQPIES